MSERYENTRGSSGDMWWQTTDNPADGGSRGDQLGREHSWWNGPKWLPDPNCWPPNIVSEPSKETAPKPSRYKPSQMLPSANRTTLTWCWRNSACKKSHEYVQYVDPQIRAQWIVERAKTHHGSTDNKGIKPQVLDQRAQKNSSVKNDRVPLNLQRNEDGVLVCRGRIEGETPIYIPDDHTLAQSILKTY